MLTSPNVHHGGTEITEKTAEKTNRKRRSVKPADSHFLAILSVPPPHFFVPFVSLVGKKNGLPTKSSRVEN
jgi:hypothetical protein